MPKNNAEIKTHIPSMLGKLDAQLSQAVRVATLSIEAKAKLSIQTGEKSGRMHGGHQASAPGESPATDLGNLVNSIQADVKPGSLEGTVTVGADYGASLEFGTATIAPRPFLTPAVEATRKSFVTAVKKAVEEAAR